MRAAVISRVEIMTQLPPLALRVLRRVGRIKGCERPALHVEDGLEQLAFWADAAERQSAKKTFDGLRSIGDHFTFSRRFFGAHQIEAEITGLLEWASARSPRRVCEIGTAMGGTTYLLGQSLPSVERLLGVDVFVRRRQRLQFFSRPHQRLTFLEGSSYAPDTISRVRDYMGGEKLDLLFIDGDHTFQGVASDFKLYRHFVKDGGVIVFHDIVEDYKTRYGRDTGRWVGDVPRFWREIKPLYQTREFVESPEQDGLGIGALIYDSAVTPPQLT
jgi:cephalosporin hydroxylase